MSWVEVCCLVRIPTESHFRGVSLGRAERLRFCRAGFLLGPGEPAGDAKND